MIKKLEILITYTGVCVDKKETRFRKAIAEVDSSLSESKQILQDLKSKLYAEETRTIGLRLIKDDLNERMRRHIASLPSGREEAQRETEIDADFLLRLPELMEKIK